MTVARTAEEILEEHTTLELECIDRLYLNMYVPILQRENGVAHFWRYHRGHDFASSSLMAPMTRSFIESIERFAEQEQIPLVHFRKGQRKEDVVKEHLQHFTAEEGVVLIGKAQEKARTVRTERRRNPNTGASYAWLVTRTTFVNYYYFYCVDRDFGPFFIKFCSYFPYNGKVCLNGHEYVKRQLSNRGIDFEPLDNGVLSCEQPDRLQRLSDGLSPAKIDAVVRKWLRRLPHPFPARDRRAGYLYELSILQAELSLTQVLDRPLAGRALFETIIREHLDLGRPDQVQLIFDRRVPRRTRDRFRFRTRVLTNGVIPSLHFDYKHSRIKQYHKEGRALRTETIINDTYDFGIGRLLRNLPQLREVGFEANRRLLRVQRISHDAALGHETFDRLQRPAREGDTRVPALRFGNLRVMALLSALVLFRLLPRGFSNSDLRLQLAPLLGRAPGDITQGMMTYDLRRLRVHGLIERIPHSHRYRVTDFGYRVALYLVRSHARLLRPGLALAVPSTTPAHSKLTRALERVDLCIDDIWRSGRVAA